MDINNLIVLIYNDINYGYKQYKVGYKLKWILDINNIRLDINWYNIGYEQYKVGYKLI